MVASPPSLLKLFSGSTRWMTTADTWQLLPAASGQLRAAQAKGTAPCPGQLPALCNSAAACHSTTWPPSPASTYTRPRGLARDGVLPSMAQGFSVSAEGVILARVGVLPHRQPHVLMAQKTPLRAASTAPPSGGQGESFVPLRGHSPAPWAPAIHAPVGAARDLGHLCTSLVRNVFSPQGEGVGCPMALLKQLLSQVLLSQCQVLRASLGSSCPFPSCPVPWESELLPGGLGLLTSLWAWPVGGAGRSYRDLPRRESFGVCVTPPLQGWPRPSAACHAVALHAAGFGFPLGAPSGHNMIPAPKMLLGRARSQAGLCSPVQMWGHLCADACSCGFSRGLEPGA